MEVCVAEDCSGVELAVAGLLRERADVKRDDLRAVGVESVSGMWAWALIVGSGRCGTHLHDGVCKALRHEL